MYAFSRDSRGDLLSKSPKFPLLTVTSGKYIKMSSFSTDSLDKGIINPHFLTPQKTQRILTVINVVVFLNVENIKTDCTSDAGLHQKVGLIINKCIKDIINLPLDPQYFS